MDNSERIIIDILKMAITKEPLVIDLDDVDIEDVHHELRMQAISPMAFQWLNQSTITDQDLKRAWIDEILQTIFGFFYANTFLTTGKNDDYRIFKSFMPNFPSK